MIVEWLYVVIKDLMIFTFIVIVYSQLGFRESFNTTDLRKKFHYLLLECNKRDNNQIQFKKVKETNKERS